ncbi:MULTISPECIES: hypothetical protein [unclassified Paraburkholderia]|uniref:hypothetical protein n=1 Tax=unclassified Paraburkholderia TaxID=2615204 RepID=UPI0038B8C0F1
MRKTRIAIVGVGLAAMPHALALNYLRDEVEVVRNEPLNTLAGDNDGSGSKT